MKTVFITYKINTSTWPSSKQLERIKKETSIKDELKKIKGVGEVFEIFFAGDHEPDFQIRAIDFTDDVIDFGQFGIDGEVDPKWDEHRDVASDEAFEVASELIEENNKKNEE